MCPAFLGKLRSVAGIFANRKCCWFQRGHLRKQSAGCLGGSVTVLLIVNNIIMLRMCLVSAHRLFSKNRAQKVFRTRFAKDSRQ